MDNLPTTGYYTVSETKLEAGNRSTTTEYYRDGKLAWSKRNIELRYRTNKTDIETIESVISDLLHDPDKFDVNIKLDKKDNAKEPNKFDLVVSYSRLIKD